MTAFFNKHFSINKAFLASLAAIALPIGFQNIISLAVQLMDTLMLGSLGDVALAAANLGGQPFFILMITGFGFSSGGTVLIAQYWGKGDKKVIRQIISITMRFLLALSLLFTVVCFFFSHQILSLYSNEPEVIEAGAGYLQLLSLSFVFFSSSSCFLVCLRAVESVKASAVIYTISLFVNVFFNYMFIFGEFGAPELGVRGAAVGTVLARFSELTMVIIYMHKIEKTLMMRIKDFFAFNKSLIPDYIRYSLPVVGNEIIWSVGTTVVAMIIGNIGSQFVAANSIAGLVFQVASVFTFGIASAAAVLCGKCIGQGGTRQDAQKLAHNLLLIVFSVGLVSGLFIISISGVFPKLYDVSDGASQLATQMILVMGAVMPISAIDALNIVGILRGGGDTKTSLLIDCGAVWCISVPLGLITGFLLGWSPIFVYMTMRIDTVFKATLSCIRVLSGKWIRNVTRDNVEDINQTKTS